MAVSFELEATLRQDTGKGASRRLRRTDQIPAVIYGGGKEAISLMLDHNKVANSLQNSAFYTRVLTLKIQDQPEKVILKALQRHAFKPRIQHMDFLRVRADEKLKMNVPLHFVGAETSPGVLEGGLVSHLLSDVEISCLPEFLPDSIDVDVSTLALDQLLHLSDLKLPNGVEIVSLTHGRDLPVASIHLPRAEEPEAAPVVVDASAVPASEQKAPDAIEAAKKDEKKDEKKGDKK